MLKALLARYRPSGAVESADWRRCQRLAAEAADPWSRALPLHFTASAVVVDRAGGRVLLRWHARSERWLHVGGHGDPGERDPLVIAQREAAEETGLTDLRPWPGEDLIHLVVCDVLASRGEPAHQHADLRFVLATGRPEAIVPEDDQSPLRWVSLAEAHAEADPGNLAVTLDRVGRLLTLARRPPDPDGTPGVGGG